MFSHFFTNCTRSQDILFFKDIIKNLSWCQWCLVSESLLSLYLCTDIQVHLKEGSILFMPIYHWFFSLNRITVLKNSAINFNIKLRISYPPRICLLNKFIYIAVIIFFSTLNSLVVWKKENYAKISTQGQSNIIW